MSDLPVALIFFIRDNTLSKVFEQIKKAKPKKLFLIQDGPREGNESDKEKIMKCREIVENVDWECEVFKNYSDINLGCGKRPSSGISWVFEHVDRAIILEDDCVPNMSFFSFCDKMLEKYKDDERIMLVSGTNHLGKYEINNYSYFYSKCLAIWGWATWKRAWDKYDFNMDSFDDKKVQKDLLNEIKIKCAKKSKMDAWKLTRESIKNNKKISWWDLQWHYALYINNALGVVPKYNLISNIGFGNGATHVSKRSEFHSIKTYEIDEYIEPPTMMQDLSYDKIVYEMTCDKTPIIIKKLSKLKRKVFNNGQVD